MDWQRTRQSAASILILGQCLLSCMSQVPDQPTECSQLEYTRCMHMAEPLLRNPDYVFPDNVRDIGRVCSVWGDFVQCVQGYTQKCFSESRQVAFDKAVQDTKESMRQMCHVSHYQTEYLKHAGCMKSMLTREQNCGKHYQQLARQVYGDVTHSTLCCSLHVFRECMISEVRSECDHGQDDGQANHFTRHTLDKALSFLREQCYNYVPSSGECPGLGLTPTGRSEDARGYTPGHTAPVAGPWTPPPRGGPSLSDPTDDFSPWYPRQSDTAAGSSHHNPSVSYPDGTTPLSSPDYMPSRASTFGRGMAWTPSPSSWSSVPGSSWTPSTSTWTPPPGNSWTPPSALNSWASSSNSWTPSTSTWSPSPRSWTPPSSSWADPWTSSSKSWRPPSTSSSSPQDPWTPSPASTWRVTSGGSSQLATDSWYPSSGNTVDEPNQQGLTGNVAAPRSSMLSLLLAALVVVACALC